MSKLFISQIDKKLMAIEEKKNNIYQNIYKQDLSKRDSEEYITEKLIKIYLKEFKVSNRVEAIKFIEAMIKKIQNAFPNKTPTLKELNYFMDNKNKKKIEVNPIIIEEINVPKVEIKIDSSKRQTYEPVPGDLIKSFNEPIQQKNKYGGWCDPNEILVKQKKTRNNSFFCAKFEGYDN